MLDDRTEDLVIEDTEPSVADLDLVEARVHLAAAQYHNCLANGKLIPRPPGSRPASAGSRQAAGRPRARALNRPWSASGISAGSRCLEDRQVPLDNGAADALK
ncbi:unnamed protein product, partial [Effrenium voratum]